MIIRRDYDLTALNTFGVSARAKFFAEIESERELSALFRTEEFQNNKKLFLGGGSNILFTRDFPGIVVHNKLKGIEIIPVEGAEKDKVRVRGLSGEIWHDLVKFASARGLWGIENLSLIPGTVGGAPVQNIGAYGAELKDVLQTVEAYAVASGEKRIFENHECQFGYRDSTFKRELKGQYFISAIILGLNKTGAPNTEYKILKEYLEKNKIQINGPADISAAVATIRTSKLPDPKVIGNAGSFFKNVFISQTDLERMLKIYPEMPYFEEDDNIKIPSGWLIEQCNWKGKRVGNVGVHEKQALVLVNYGGATGEEIYNLAKQIIMSVEAKFGLRLESEVNIIGLLS